MSDSEIPAGSGGGPRYLQGAARPVDLQPAVVAAPAATYRDGTLAVEGRREDLLFANRYSRTGATPIPHMVVGLFAMAAAAWALSWAEWDRSAPGLPRTSEWWINVTSVLVPAEEVGLGAYSTGRMWVALGVLVGAAVMVVIWMGRVGTNVRAGNSPFGTVLPVIAFPAWWLLPLTINATAGGVRSRSDLLIRYLVAFGILFAQFLLARWPVTNRIWRAGRLPYDMASIVLWLPMLIPWMMLFASNAWTLLIIGDDGELSDSAWRPTETMADWALWTTRASGLATIALLCVVSVRQHQGLAQDRADDEAARGR